MRWINAVIQGVLVGGLYALYATGLSITFGVMRLVNLAHGDAAVAAAFVASTIMLATGWSPFATLLILLPLAFLTGMAVQRVAFDRLVGVDPSYQIVATFGLAIVIQNVLLQRYSATPRALNIGSFGTKSIKITDQIAIGWFPLTRFLVAVAVLAAISLFLSRTRFGRAFRATSDDPATARLMGINNRTVYAVALGLSAATVALAGVFNGAQTQFSAFDGPLLLLFAFEAVIIGGLGSLWGTLAGGIILGLAQTLGAEIEPGWKQLSGHVVFLIVLAVRPTGLFPKQAT
ncbi:MAG TPA: branched-chain amino acid ABC transporter permease [Acidimicrobiales bacterium]|nr:branched-chain amino acid ABC transporter permease [Acidimicrobiales bacterium]